MPRFLYYGHSTVGLTTPEGDHWLIDPWLKGNPRCPERLYRPERIDAMLITHAHMDHMGDVVALAKKYVPRAVVASFEICTWLGWQGVQNLAPMGMGGTQEVLGQEVNMVRADHSSGIIAGDEAAGILDGGLPTGYVVRTSDNLSFYHAGDTALFSDMALVAELYGPSVGFIPIGDLFTMGPKHAAVACELLRLERAVPIHWATFPGLTGTPEAFTATLAATGSSCKAIILQPGETLD